MMELQNWHLGTFLLAMVLMCSTFAAKADPIDSVADRIKPVGEVNVAVPEVATAPSNSATEAAAPGKISGKAIYEAHCVVCHAQGVAGAPKLGDKAAWGPRIEAAGKRSGGLLTTVKKGLNAMPPMGACMNCTDAQLQAAIDYMKQ